LEGGRLEEVGGGGEGCRTLEGRRLDISVEARIGWGHRKEIGKADLGRFGGEKHWAMEGSRVGIGRLRESKFGWRTGIAMDCNRGKLDTRIDAWGRRT
jgi:hypothetical protein